MKKFLALLVALTMMLTAVSALATSSIDVTDLTEEETEFTTILDDEESIALVNDELTKLTEAEDPNDYFKKGDEIAAIIGEGPYNVFEMVAFTISDAEALAGRDLEWSFATSYEEGTVVAVLIGIVGEADEEIEWNVYEGTVDELGHVHVTLDAEILEQIEDGTALIAIASK
ncbi:MAG: hypothetical protein IJ662_06560 [Clostridia bacterium]|nr:hypothetical protein [Clostridia bacterium]